MMNTDELYMARCLQLAAMAEGQTSPNPMVGAVIVRDGVIIGEGFHHKAGQPHAEPNAVANVIDQNLLRGATIYVSLEPCSHWGKTPPCADLIVKKGFRRVVVATLDPNPKVSGRGVKMIRDAGIDVIVGVLENEARWLNRRFLTLQEKKRPYVILKWAQTADGFIDACRSERGNGPVKISSAVTKTLNHQVRAQEDAIMVATNTAVLDDPHLTVTKWSGRNPLRVLLDRSCRVPVDARIFDADADTLVFTSEEGLRLAKNRKYGDNVNFAVVDFSLPLAKQVLDVLADKNILSLIVEGGSMWLQSFIDSNLWDEARVETGEMLLNEGVKAPVLRS